MLLDCVSSEFVRVVRVCRRGRARSFSFPKQDTRCAKCASPRARALRTREHERVGRRDRLGDRGRVREPLEVAADEKGVVLYVIKIGVYNGCI